jgi:hypothetical protein
MVLKRPHLHDLPILDESAEVNPTQTVKACADEIVGPALIDGAKGSGDSLQLRDFVPDVVVIGAGPDITHEVSLQFALLRDRKSVV